MGCENRSARSLPDRQCALDHEIGKVDDLRAQQESLIAREDYGTEDEQCTHDQPATPTPPITRHTFAEYGGNKSRATKTLGRTYRWLRKLESEITDTRKGNTPSAPANQ